MTTHPDLPTALRVTADASGLTRAQIAAAMGYAPNDRGSAPAVSRAISGAPTPKIPWVASFARAVGVAISWREDGAVVTVEPGASAKKRAA